MKKVLIFMIFTLFTSSMIALGEEASQEAKAIEESSDPLESAMSVSGVKKAYDACKVLHQNDKKALSDCVWKELSPAAKEEVQRVVESTKDGKDLKARYESVSTGGMKKSQTKGLENLENFLYEKLSAVLFEEVSKDNKNFIKEKVVGQEIFYDLFKTQVGKNIISAFSSVCLEANYVYKTNAQGEKVVDGFTLSESASERKKAREANMKDVATFSPQSKEQYMSCIHFVPRYCSCTIDDKTKKCNDNQSDQYTKMRACEVTNFIKTAKQNLIAIDKIKEGYDKLDLVASSDPTYNSGSEKGKTIDDLTTMTSGEFVKETKFHEGNIEDKKTLEECVTNKELSNCESFLQEQDENFLAEQVIRNKALTEKLKEDLADDTNLEKYLKDQGYSDEKIKTMMEGDIEKLKAEIAGRYEIQKNQVIESLSKKLQETTNPDATPEEIETEKTNRLVKIGDELTNKAESYAQLIHYSNVVAGYLEIKTDDQTQGRATAAQSEALNNTYSISRELSDSAFSEEGTKKAREVINTFNSGDIIVNADEAQKKLEEAGIKVQHNPSENASSKVLEVDDINDVVNDYSKPEEAP